MTPQQYQAVITLMGGVMFWLIVNLMYELTHVNP
jgi:hypothetical protein